VGDGESGRGEVLSAHWRVAKLLLTRTQGPPSTLIINGRQTMSVTGFGPCNGPQRLLQMFHDQFEVFT
jgi:hypothetical protein